MEHEAKTIFVAASTWATGCGLAEGLAKVTMNDFTSYRQKTGNEIALFVFFDVLPFLANGTQFYGIERSKSRQVPWESAKSN